MNSMLKIDQLDITVRAYQALRHLGYNTLHEVFEGIVYGRFYKGLDVKPAIEVSGKVVSPETVVTEKIYDEVITLIKKHMSKEAEVIGCEYCRIRQSKECLNPKFC